MRQSEAIPEGQTTQLMQAKIKAAHYFMSTNSPSGFVSYFERLYNAEDGWKAYILKGAPGIAPLLLSKSGNRLEDAGLSVEYIHCVSDPNGVSALVLPELKVCIADGMPPHCIVPEFPGVVEEEITLCDVDAEKLAEQREHILQFAARAAAQYDRAYRFLSAAVSLQGDTYRIALENTDSEAIEKYASGLSKRLFVPHGDEAKDTPRYLSGITADGIVCFSDSILSNYARVFLIEDDYGIGSLLLTALREKALSCGLSVVTCNCSMLPDERPEHLLIPSLSIAFLTSNRFHRIESRSCRHINIKRFMDCDSLRLKKARIGFNRRASRELFHQAVSLFAEAKADDDIVKSCYTPCIKLEKAQKKIDKLTDKLAEMAAELE